MSEVYEVDPLDIERSASGIQAARDALTAGELVVFPTETVYGIGGRPDDPRVTDRIFEAKRRPRGLNLPVLAPSARVALSLVRGGEAADRLARRFWPGPLTLVMGRSRLTLEWRLGERSESIAVRVPEHAVCSELLRLAGPLAATSANVSGRPPLSDPAELAETFGWAVSVYIFLPAGSATGLGEASTVLDLTTEPPSLIRPGPLELDRLLAVLQGNGLGAPG